VASDLVLDIPMFINGKEKYSSEKILLKDKFTGENLASVAASSASDLNYAIKTSYASSKKMREIRIDEILSVTEKVAETFFSQENKLDLIARITGSPYKYVSSSIANSRQFLKKFQYFLDTVFGSRNFLETGKPIYEGRQKIGLRIYSPRGNIVALFLAGNEVSLAPFIIPQIIATRTPLIIKGSTAEPISTYELIKAYHDAGLKTGINLLFWSSAQRPELAAQLLKQAHTQVLFGSDDNILNLIGTMKQPMSISERKHIIPFWTGRSTAIVLADADLEMAAKNVIEGGHLDRGNKCVSTKKVYVQQEVFETFVNLLKKQILTLNIGPSTQRQVDVGFAPKEEREQVAKKLKKEINIIHNGITNDTINVTLVLANNESEFAREEIPAPVLALIPVKSLDEAITLANAAVSHAVTKKSLATTIFTTNKDKLETAVQSLETFKILVNKPTTNMNFFLPHQGKYIIEELLSADKVIDL